MVKAHGCNWLRPYGGCFGARDTRFVLQIHTFCPQIHVFWLQIHAFSGLFSASYFKYDKKDKVEEKAYCFKSAKFDKCVEKGEKLANSDRS